MIYSLVPITTQIDKKYQKNVKDVTQSDTKKIESLRLMAIVVRLKYFKRP